MAITPKENKDFEFHEGNIIKAIAHGPLNVFRNQVAVPNTNGFLGWEADLLVVSNAGYLSEVEVKVSVSGWKVDKKKVKWKVYQGYWKMIKFFWYAAPEKLAERWEEFDIPEWAGVYSVYPPAEFYTIPRVRVLRVAKQRQEFRKLSDREICKLAKLGALRIWT